MADDWFLDRFQRSEKLSAYWHNKAQDLLGAVLVLAAAQEKDGTGDFQASDIGLWDGYSFAIALPPVFSLNAGLALELLLKAAIVKRDNGPQNVPTKGGNAHSLNYLVNELQIELNNDDVAVLGAYSLHIQWMGRYPVPKSRELWDSANKVIDRLMMRKQMGPNSKIMVRSRNPQRSLGKESFLRLWNQFSKFYNDLPSEKY